MRLTKRVRAAQDALLGRRFTHLEVTGPFERRGSHTLVRCRCDCGRETVVSIANLRRGASKSCGCFRRVMIGKGNTKHGATSGPCRTTEYGIWKGMITRCYNRNATKYPSYGGRGITVCDRWRHDFAAFLSDVGLRPSLDHSLDRIDNDHGYKPGNVRWATRIEQARNTRRNIFIVYDGFSLTPAEWAARTGIARSTVQRRFEAGWPAERILSVVDHRRRA